jgi:cytochrome bd ubiquinol oxidase subunit I
MTDPLDLARVQFAANITFHILFPTISIALSWLLLFFHLRFRRTGDEKWSQAYQFWIKIFALTFALGVVSGITMSFQFGTNWPGFMQTVGNVAGPLLAYEVLTAFFLEATFLGIMLFGVKRVSPRTLTIAIFMVAFGTTLSAFWIIALNSWMHTPAGFVMVEGKAYAADWLAVIFNPSMPYRLTHMLIASGLTVCFLVSGISAYRWLRGDQTASVLSALKTAITLAAFLIPIQMLVGDQHGLNTLKYEPAKIAAIEGIWHTESGASLRLFAIPDTAKQTNLYEVSIPKLGSLILTHSWDGEIKGIDAFEGKHPPVPPLFFGFRIMVGISILMLVVSWFGAWMLWRREMTTWLARGLVAMTFAGWLATVAGWYVTEIGRQPYLVHGVLMTADAVSHLPAPTIAATLALYLVTYIVLILSYIAVIFHLARKASEHIDEGMMHSAAAELKELTAKL